MYTLYYYPNMSSSYLYLCSAPGHLHLIKVWAGIITIHYSRTLKACMYNVSSKPLFYKQSGADSFSSPLIFLNINMQPADVLDTVNHFSFRSAYMFVSDVNINKIGTVWLTGTQLKIYKFYVLSKVKHVETP